MTGLATLLTLSVSSGRIRCGRIAPLRPPSIRRQKAAIILTGQMVFAYPEINYVAPR